ncbi:1,6-anhydro-N-acetylmuramyl-L-alanine amidase AmpD [Aurantivibrio plasticivorans]
MSTRDSISQNLSYQIRHGWLEPAVHVTSPNYDSRPVSCEVDLLVIHNISLPPGQFGGGEIEQLFCNTLACEDHPYFERLRGLRVSSHLLIERTGRVIQFVSFNDRAWHAGKSLFDGREACNDFAIGIELEGADDIPYTPEQYRQLSAITQTLMQVYPGIDKRSIVGHCDIAPGRKTDPGPAFEWARFLGELSG